MYCLIFHSVSLCFFASEPNKSIANINEHLIEFFNDTVAFLLFQTEEKPFPFKSSDEDDSLPEEEVIIEGEADIIRDESSEQPNN